MLKGETVNLRIMEKEDLHLLADSMNNPDFFGEYVWLPQLSRMDREKWYEGLPPEARFFLIEKKDGTVVGNIAHFPEGSHLEIGYMLLPNERRKGYCSEAVKIMIDYLFLSRDVVRIQAHTDARNVGSQRVLEKNSFKKEGIIRRRSFIRGEWRDMILFSILREEWKEPKTLTRASAKHHKN